ncbi:transmembrane protein 272 [Strongylocentrotus purpuratus]|uniref:Transmembrane protein n=1 Tax=Strongylocentrotus purpuratus TaxID=7668 RepID=A0A7M7NIV6_STRPU|nr:transmembrane protein 272 [Strongylocentrotus purpuratus]
MAQDNNAIAMSPTDPTAPPSNDATQQDGSPLSYQSIFGKIKSEKEKNASPLGFIGSVVKILLDTFIVTLFMALMLAIPITMVAIGAVYLDDCPAERFIPIYLITMGAAYIVKLLIDLKGRAQRSRLPQEEQAFFEPNKVEGGLSHLIGVFCFAFFIAGNVWIYRIYKPNTTVISDADYCHPTLYYFAFWVTTVCYIIAASSAYVAAVWAACPAAAPWPLRIMISKMIYDAVIDGDDDDDSCT